jgi:hypothetical protein
MGGRFVEGRSVEGCFVEGRLVGRTFCSGGRFVEGRFVLVPSNHLAGSPTRPQALYISKANKSLQCLQVF